MTQTRPPEQKRNSYEDDDMRVVIDQVETYETQKAKIMATAMGECAGLARKIKDLKKQAKDELGISLKVLNPILKRRKLERKIADISDSIDDDYVEVFEDAAGQFCMFAPYDEGDAETADDPDDTPPAHDDPSETELAEGEEVLSQVKH